MKKGNRQKRRTYAWKELCVSNFPQAGEEVALSTSHEGLGLGSTIIEQHGTHPSLVVELR